MLRDARRRRRAVGLTSLIDVIFLLLLFFMLASSFTRYQVTPVTAGVTGGGAETRPALLRVHDAARLDLNGAPVPPETLADRLETLGQGPTRSVAIWTGEGARVQDLVSAVSAVRLAGLAPIVLSGGADGGRR